MENIDHINNYKLVDHLVLLDRCTCKKCQKEADKYRKELSERNRSSEKIDAILNKSFDKKDS